MANMHTQLFFPFSFLALTKRNYQVMTRIFFTDKIHAHGQVKKMEPAFPRATSWTWDLIQIKQQQSSCDISTMTSVCLAINRLKPSKLIYQTPQEPLHVGNFSCHSLVALELIGSIAFPWIKWQNRSNMSESIILWSCYCKPKERYRMHLVISLIQPDFPRRLPSSC